MTAPERRLLLVGPRPRVRRRPPALSPIEARRRIAALREPPPHLAHLGRMHD